jgi:hypothetical protein
MICIKVEDAQCQYFQLPFILSFQYLQANIICCFTYTYNFIYSVSFKCWRTTSQHIARTFFNSQAEVTVLQFRLTAQGGCDRSAEDTYSSLASDPTFSFVEGPCYNTLDFVFAFWIVIMLCTLLTSLFCILTSI